MNQDLKIEKMFFSHCAKVNLSEEDIEVVQRRLRDSIDWSFIKTHRWKALIPLVYNNFKEIDTNLIPPKVLKDLEMNSNFLGLRTILIYKDLNTLLSNFYKNKISCLLLQGVAFADIIYKDTTQRPMDDLDILVHKEDWPKIKEILCNLKYKTDYDASEIEGISPTALNQHVHYISSRGVEIEFKFNLFYLSNKRDINSDGVWKEAISRQIFDFPVFMLSPEDNLLYLASHMNKHSFNRLIWFVDFYELIRFYQDRLNWELLIEKARQKNLNYSLYFTLTFIDNFFPKTIAVKWIDELGGGILRRKFFNFMWDTKKITSFKLIEEKSRLQSDIISAFFMGKLNLRDFIRYILKTLFPKREYLIYRYRLSKNSRLIWRYYLIRIFYSLRSLIKNVCY